MSPGRGTLEDLVRAAMVKPAMGDSAINPIAFAIPIFLAFVALEAIVARRRAPGVYHLGTALSDMSCGVVMQALDVFFNVAALAAYAYLFEHWRLVDFDANRPWVWILAILGVDVMFYWWHRASHVVNVLWAVHGVHHQSEDYNLAVALRQPAFEPITWFFFYAPLALLGVPPLLYILAYAINRFYQFFIHTQLVDKLGPTAELLLNTPSHHRVHHGIEDEYLDKNYGAVLIIWDRLFGTFEPEVKPPTYGTTIPIRDYGPIWGNLQHFAVIGRLMAHANSIGEAAWAIVAHPAWLPRGMAEPAKPNRRAYHKYRPLVDDGARRYAAAHFVLFALLFFVFVLLEPLLSWRLQLVGVVTAIVSVAAFMSVLSGRRFVRSVEPGRIVLASIALLLLSQPAVGIWMALALALSYALFGGATWSLWLANRPDNTVHVEIDDIDMA